MKLFLRPMHLMEGLKQGDVNVFNKIYTDYHQRLYFFIRKKTQSDFMAEEVVQLTFIKLWHNKQRLNANINLSLQVFHMAKQVMIDELRKEATRCKHEQQELNTSFASSLAQMIEAKDLMRIFEKELSNMSSNRQLIFNLSREKGLSHKEIAALMGLSTKTVESHIGKVLSQLKQYMYSILL